MRRFGMILVGTAGLLLAAVGPATAHDPTCSDVGFLAIEVHGQHVVRDYVTGGELSGWPATGGVGQYVAGEGAAVPGGPGPGFHFVIGAAPGASFCIPQAGSPGFHLGG